MTASSQNQSTLASPSCSISGFHRSRIASENSSILPPITSWVSCRNIIAQAPFSTSPFRFILNVVIIVSGYQPSGEHFHRLLHPEKVKWQLEMDGFRYLRPSRRFLQGNSLNGALADA